ncbi:MAG TPA: endolytic transglycosylase MltG, partial [Candidatus Dojkabacteria bacterium]|nr:endolytic transglycosylase MltG [Candidatus Dojkabacteria bacterium]
MKRENNPPLGKIFAMILGAFLILVFVVFNSYKKALITPNSDKSETINFQIEEGTSVDTILENLINSNLLRRNNRLFTKAYLRFSELGDKIQAGSYQIPQNLNIKELINTLQNGKEQDIWVTIPEGLRKDEIAELIEKELNKYESTDFSKEGFLELTENPEFISTLNLPIETSNLEGFLFPDKYALSPNSTTESVMNRLIKN